jgi:3-oxoacyl-(acyl-carrier-protein) synthase
VEHEPIVVTGVGCVSALGHSVEAFWSALQDGRCGLRKRDESALSDLKVSPVGAIPAPDPRHMLDARRLPITGPFQRIGDRCSSAGPGTVGSVHGHASGASGSLELIAVIEAIRRGIVPPTINIEELDPECDLDVTPGCARARPIRAAVSNAFAFGGTNAVVAVKRFDG